MLRSDIFLNHSVNAYSIVLIVKVIKRMPIVFFFLGTYRGEKVAIKKIQSSYKPRQVILETFQVS